MTARTATSPGHLLWNIRFALLAISGSFAFVSGRSGSKLRYWPKSDRSSEALEETYYSLDEWDVSPPSLDGQG